MLVQDDFASEKLAEENKGSIFQKADSMAGDRHIGYIGTMNQQLPKDAQKGGNKPHCFSEQQGRGESVYLIISSGGGQIDVGAFKRRVDETALLNLPTHQTGAVYRRRKRYDEQDAFQSWVELSGIL